MPRVLAFGDSNTFGTGPMRSLTDGPLTGYRDHPRDKRWANVMGAALGDDWEVIVEGLPGRTSVFDDPVEGVYRNGLRSMRAILESHRPLDVVIILLGTNDTKQRMGLGPQDIALGVARLAREALELEHIGQVLVLCPPPVKERGDLAEMFKGAEERFRTLNTEMERFASEAGAAFMDAGAVIEVDEIDGVHWSLESHGVLGRAVAEKIRGMV